MDRIGYDFYNSIEIFALALSQATNSTSVECAVLEADKKGILGEVFNRAFLLDSPDVSRCSTAVTISGSLAAQNVLKSSMIVLPCISISSRVQALFNSWISQDFGLFAGGIAGAESAYTDKYIFDLNSIVRGTDLSNPRGKISGIGNSSRAHFSGGLTAVNTTLVYTYSNNTTTSAANLTLARIYFAACSNSTIGVYAGGFTTDFTDYTEKYNLSNGTKANGTVLGEARDNLGAVGNSTVAIFGRGLKTSGPSSRTDKYTYSGDVVTAGTTLTPEKNNYSGTGTSTIGIIGTGTSGSSRYSSTEKYTYSNDVTAVGATLSLARTYASATGNATIGIFGGGYTTVAVATTDRYTYNSDAVIPGVSLGIARNYLAATGQAHGGLQ